MIALCDFVLALICVMTLSKKRASRVVLSFFIKTFIKKRIVKRNQKVKLVKKVSEV